MVLCTLLLVSLLLQCSSLKNKLKVEIPDNTNSTKINPEWQTECKSRWDVLSGKAIACNFTVNTKENCPVVSGLYDVRKANELFISISSESRKFSLTDKVFRGTFPLLVLYGESRKPDDAFTKFVGMFPNLTSDTLNDKFFRATNIISFSRNQSYNKVRLVLQESLFCGNVKSVSMFYYKCPSDTAELVNFKEKAAPNKSSSPIELKGSCTSNAIQKWSPLTMRCYFNGTFEVFGSCECKAGFTNLTNKCKG